MASKTYQLNITKSDGTSETVSFVIPDIEGTYKVKFALSDGREIDAGSITVDDAEHSYELRITLSDESTINAGTIVTPVEVFQFAGASWSEIAEISEAGNANEYFAVGDEKTITLSTGEEITLVILGFDHDDLSDGSGKAGMTIGMKNLLTEKYRLSATQSNKGGWNETEMRTSTMATLLSQLPSDLQDVIKQVNKKATAGWNSTSITTSADKLWLFAEVEIEGTTDAGYVDEGEQYEYWKTVKDGRFASNRKKYLSNGSGSAQQWWLRSPCMNQYSYFTSYTEDGYGKMAYPDEYHYVSYGFCV